MEKTLTEGKTYSIHTEGCGIGIYTVRELFGDRVHLFSHATQSMESYGISQIEVQV